MALVGLTLLWQPENDFLQFIVVISSFVAVPRWMCGAHRRSRGLWDTIRPTLACQTAGEQLGLLIGTRLMDKHTDLAFFLFLVARRRVL